MSKPGGFIDMTYWRFRRWLRRCAECGQKTANHPEVTRRLAKPNPKNQIK